MLGAWILGAVIGLLGLLGLFMASYADDAVFHGTGLGLFVFAVVVIGWLIRRGSKPKEEEEA